MITKEQAMTETNFLQIAMQFIVNGQVKPLPKSIAWRANGKCKVWKRDPERFQLPIKHGLYSYGYITNENAHLFTVKP